MERKPLIAHGRGGTVVEYRGVKSSIEPIRGIPFPSVAAIHRSAGNRCQSTRNCMDVIANGCQHLSRRFTAWWESRFRSRKSERYYANAALLSAFGH